MSSLAEKLQRSLSEWKPSGEGRSAFTQTLPEEGWTVNAAFEKAESVGGSVWELVLDRTGEAPQGLTLKGWAERVANQVSGLLEKLKVYEIDEANSLALLRSDGPQARGTVRNYYEVTLSGLKTATLRRYQSDTTPGSKRSQAAFGTTYETLAQVVAGMTT